MLVQAGNQDIVRSLRIPYGKTLRNSCYQWLCKDDRYLQTAEVDYGLTNTTDDQK
ncbi:MAG TPA: hypothetical protein VD794_09675 [Flavisolibacter sp.]|nr:hypothetical protein [Flavisolibacter sp.]